MLARADAEMSQSIGQVFRMRDLVLSDSPILRSVPSGKSCGSSPNETCQAGSCGCASGFIPCTNSCPSGQVCIQPIAIAAGSFHTCALLQGGVVEWWGNNRVGELGVPISTTPLTSPSPVVVQSSSGTGFLTGVTAISAGGSHTCALLVSGGIQCWGDNTYGQLGNGAAGSGSATPMNVTSSNGTGTLTGVTAISAVGLNTCALVNKVVYCWGDNSSGQTGSTSTTNVTAPRIVQTAAGASLTALAVSAGSTACALINKGGPIQCWGDDAQGQLGDGSTNSTNVPVNVVSLPAGATSIAAGAGATYAIVSGGVYSWGDNSDGQLGIGSAITSAAFPSSITGLSGATMISASDQACALTGGTVSCWGFNYYGQVGRAVGTPPYVYTPVVVSGLSGVTAVSAGGSHTCALQSNGIVQCWGINSDGQLGTGSTLESNVTPAPVLW